MSEETILATGPTIFSSDSVPTSGNEQLNDGGEQPQQSAAPQAPSRSESQEKSLAIVADLRAKGAQGPLSAAERARLDQHWRHAHAGGATPLELRIAPTEDHREIDAVRDKLEAEAQPISKEAQERLVARMTVQGISSQGAQAAMSLAEKLGLDEAGASTFAARYAKHEGGHPLDAEQAAEFEAEAARALGGTEKLAAVVEKARAFLAARGVLGELDRAGITSSSLGYDPRMLLSLAAAADRAGIK